MYYALENLKIIWVWKKGGIKKYFKKDKWKWCFFKCITYMGDKREWKHEFIKDK